jgi:hypothetical protein
VDRPGRDRQRGLAQIPRRHLADDHAEIAEALKAILEAEFDVIVTDSPCPVDGLAAGSDERIEQVRPCYCAGAPRVNLVMAP